jgi:large conductance mechanosensitive channel
VNGIIMPIVGVLLGGVDFSSLSVVVGDAVIALQISQTIVNFPWCRVAFLVIKSSIQYRSNTKEKKHFISTRGCRPA